MKKVNKAIKKYKKTKKESIKNSIVIEDYRDYSLIYVRGSSTASIINKEVAKEIKELLK